MITPAVRLSLAAALLLSLSMTTAGSQQEPAPGRQSASSHDDLYAVPDAPIAALEACIDRIRDFRPGDTNEMLEHERRAPAALRKAARRIMDLKPDRASTAYTKASTILLEEAIEKIDTAGRERVDQLCEQLCDALTQKKRRQPLVGRDMRLALDVIDRLEQDDTSKSATAYRRFGKLFEDSHDLEMASMARLMQGAARRLELPGNTMRLTGLRMDGTAFDLASLRGKVVLVDFWATWCAPCVAEHPRLLAAYRKYHDRGFEVVGVSLDNNRQQLEQYLTQHNIPWITLHPNQRGKQNPALERYGIISIPVVILIDRQGRVITTEARGEGLDQLIEAALAGAEERKGTS